ncbi:TrmB family transcriptional regulator [Halocatena marina]|uniref:TrmB family transcriptional regulator n=1 Tax=Halocatena marina TaxID=2934937 RepID=A0ABD5YMC9_9EURY|nr:TrmB family transcriptional regulator [Halocatena marina]
MDTDELVVVLKRAGFSPYQADAYVTLLELGATSASDLADASGVPKPRIYDVVRDLEDRGYVVTYEQDRLYARANDPTEALTGLQAQINQFESAVEEIQSRWHEPNPDEHDITLVQHFQSVFDRARSDIESAEWHIQLAVTPDQFYDLRPLLQQAHERGVYVQISLYAHRDEILPVEPTNLQGVCTEARHRELPSAFFLLTDRTRVCYAPHVHSPREYGVLIDDRVTAYVFHWFFLTCLWEVHDPIYTDRSETPPFTFVEIRECIRFVEPFLLDEATITARVEGYNSRTGRERDLSGEIIGVDYTGSSSDNGPATIGQLAGKASIILDTGEETYTVGGKGAIIEKISADRITVETIDEYSDSTKQIDLSK